MFALLLKLLPAIIQLAEIAIPLAGAGSRKFDMVMGVVNRIVPLARDMQPQLTAIVDNTVALLNRTGAIKVDESNVHEHIAETFNAVRELGAAFPKSGD